MLTAQRDGAEGGERAPPALGAGSVSHSPVFEWHESPPGSARRRGWSSAPWGGFCSSALWTAPPPPPPSLPPPPNLPARHHRLQEKPQPHQSCPTAVPSLPRRRRRNPKRRHRRWSRCVDTEAGYRGRSLVAVSRTYDATAHGAGRTGFLPLDACAATALLLLRWRVIIGIVCAAVCPASSHKERVVYGAAAALGARHWDKGGCEQWACPGWVRGCVCLWSAEGVELRRRREP
jgi:hypothetical protein